MFKPLLSFAALLICITANAQTHFIKKWDHTFGGPGKETLVSLTRTSDGGYLLGGYTKSDSVAGEVSQPNNGLNTEDYWIVKTDSLGNFMWDKRFGGNLTEKLGSAEQTSD